MARTVAAHGENDLIAAPATAPGAGAIAIVRLSGPGATDAAGRLFSHPLSDAEAGSLTLGTLMHPATKEPIDRCMAVRWVAARSYTGEEVVEFHLHGSPAIVDRVMEACVGAGARVARPGEFTRRAFLNGKIDLAQAEAINDLARAQTDEARRAALAQLAGGLSAQLEAIRGELVRVTAELEAAIDFPEEGIEPASRTHLLAMLDAAATQLRRLLESFGRGRLLQRGARIVFAGPPNAGKSSLLNAILGRERAIVTPHAGTTRDSIEAVIDLEGIPVTLVDTAGLRANPEEIEALGIEKTREEMQAADLVLFMVDYRERDAAFGEYASIRHLDHLVVFNKAEHLAGILMGGGGFEAGPGNRHGIHFVSARERQGIERLEQAMLEYLRGQGSEGGGNAVITSARHAEALRGAQGALSGAREGLAGGVSPELVVVDLQTAISSLDTITGRRELDEEILDMIFSRFCLGK